MRSTEERLAAVRSRTVQIEAQNRRQRAMVTSVASVIAALAFIIGVAVTMPAAMADCAVEPASSGGGMYASILASNGALGYVFVAVLAFILGACVTILCFRLQGDKNPRTESAAGTHPNVSEGSPADKTAGETPDER